LACTIQPFSALNIPSEHITTHLRAENTVMHLIGTLIVGLIVGALAKLIMPGKDPGGIIVTIILGIAGAFVGGFLGRLLHLYQPDQPAGWFMSLVGALILLAIYRWFKGRSVTA
jgi:uncharacterized membrane protein YeaQ/YmgE (transglycosylase-associated protein family)